MPPYGPDNIVPHDGVLPQLADPPTYQPCQWDLTRDAAKRAYWLDLFANHFPSLLRHALKLAEHDGVDLADARHRADAAKQAFLVDYLDRLRDEPDAFVPRLTVLEICYQRERVLRAHGFDDPYRLAKQEETDAALLHLPALLAQLDAMDIAGRAEAVIRGVFAGNIFDLGATKTQSMFEDQRVDFHATRQKLKPRPWLVDDYDKLVTRLTTGNPHRAAVVFVDNAGPDIVLGMIPLCRFLLQRGTRVIMTANDYPALNDVTLAELRGILTRVGAEDSLTADALADGRLQTVGSGNPAPLIDLTTLRPDLVAACEREQPDLVVLEGMGRALESNFDAKLTCDALKICMVKDEGVADALGGALFDLVLRFEPA